jgi:glycosyltransferase involved in cell wall biosynthesis
MPQVDGVVGVSETTLEEARQFYRLQAPSIFVPNGVDLDGLRTTHAREALRREHDTPLRSTVLLFVGNLSRQKRPDRFLRVVADLSISRDSVYAWLVGDGPEREDCQRLAADLGIADRVRFLGYQDEVASFMTASDVFVSTSDTEGIPAVVIEAGYLGLATVAFRVGGMHECVKDGETGMLVAAGDEDALVAALRSLVDSPARRVEMGRTARGWVSQRFSIDAVGRQYEAFYTQLLGNPVSN